MQNTKKRIVIWIVAIGILLMIPLVSMQFTDEVNWDISDFAVMGTALLFLGFLYELIARKSAKLVYRSAVGVGLLGAFLLFWVNGAVGIIGSENQPVNYLFGAVFVVGLTGSLISRFKPRGMAFTLYAAALVQMLVPVIALLIWPPPATSWAPSVPGVFFLSGFFAVLFLVSALLFRQASRK